MITRRWRGWTTTPGNADAYVAHFEDSVGPRLEALDGFRGASLERVPGDDGRTEIVVVTRWDSIDAIRRPGDEQAANFIGVASEEPGELPPALDLELAGNCSARPDRDWVEREVGAFIDEVEEATGQVVVLYIGSDFEGHYGIRDELDRPIWHRRILRRPDVGGWWIWQAHDRASIDGIDGGADLNVMRGERPR